MEPEKKTALIAESLVKTKMLLGLEDNSRDPLLEYLIEDNIDLVLSYCRINCFPEPLKSLLPIMTVDRWRMGTFGKEESDKELKSISQGSKSESYGNKIEMFGSHFLNNYKLRLAPFINRKGRVPSDFDRPKQSD